LREVEYIVNNILKDSLVIGIIALFVVSSITPIVFGHNMSVKPQVQTNEHYDFKNFNKYQESESSPENQKVKTSSMEDGDIGLNFSYVKTITENLSYVIYNAYNGSELRRGRFFGSKGENFAAELLSNEMKALGLYDPTPKNTKFPYLDKLENLKTKDYPVRLIPPYLNLTASVEILEKGLTVIDVSDPSNPIRKEVPDCYISHFWNDSVIKFSYDKNLLTHNFSFDNLSIRHEPVKGCYFSPRNATWFYDFIRDTKIIELLINNKSIYSFQTLWNATLPLFESYYNFTFETLDPNDSSTWPEGFVRFDDNQTDDYVLIEEHDHFNPFGNGNNRSPPIDYDISYEGYFNNLLDSLAWTIWYKANPTCRGIIKFDIDNKTYDMNALTNSFPLIYINGTVGKPINRSVDNYKISYYINQRYNDSIVSYNVIGQINGTDQNKTVIISGLYDCWWNQGTSDSAIGMAIVLAIARYFKENNITPRYKLKFIGFSGEEWGRRGAFDYLGKYKDENIVTIIDLNQLGFNITLLEYDPSEPYFNIRFELWTNRQYIQPILAHIGKISDYTKKTGGYMPISARCDWDGGRPGNHNFFAMSPRFALNPEFKTIYILKMGAWKYHHRDGMNHIEGDSFKYYDSDDVNVSTEIAWNITKFFTVYPDAWLENVSYELLDSPDDCDNHFDSVNVSFKIKTSMPHDRVTVRAILYLKKRPFRFRNVVEKNYSLTSLSSVEDTITISLPKNAKKGNYILRLHLYNSTGGTLLYYFDNFNIYVWGRFFNFVISKIFEPINRDPIFINKFLEKASNWFNSVINKVSPPLYDLFLHLLDHRYNYSLWADDTYATDGLYMHPPTNSAKNIKYNFWTNIYNLKEKSLLYHKYN
jgi:hypothetical protein